MKISISSPLSLCIYTAVISVVAALLLRRKGRPFPPGPRGLPIIGNVQDITGGSEWVRFGTSLRRSFGTPCSMVYVQSSYKLFTGDVLGLQILHKKVLVLNSLKAIKDITEKRDNIYSSRPVLTVAGELMGLDRVRTCYSLLRKFVTDAHLSVHSDTAIWP